jgi:replicative DNA helicase
MQLSDVAAERGTLAGVLKYGAEAYDDICDIINGQSFTLPSNQVIWKCAERVLKEDAGASLDFPTLLSSANALGLPNFFDKKIEADHLRSILNTPIEKVTTRRLAAKIKKLHIGRLLLEKHEESKQNILGITGDEKIDQILGLSEGPLLELTTSLANNGDEGIVEMSSGVSELIQHVIDNPTNQMGISTGFPLIDKYIGGGLLAGGLDFCAGRAKSGKTQLADNIGINVARQGYPVLNCDTEMSKKQHQFRILANLSGVPVEEIKTGRFASNPTKLAKVRAAEEEFKKLPYSYICIAGKPFEDCLSQMRRWVIRTVGLNDAGKAHPCLVIYDYIKLMDDSMIKNGNLSEYQALGFITTGLKNFSTRYEPSMLALGQLNREGLDSEDISAIAGSDRISWFVTSASIYKWKTPEEKAQEPGGRKPRYTHKFITMLAREAERMGDGDYINMQAQYEIARITEGPMYSDMLKGKAGGFEIEDDKVV